jgi:uncharacterized protein YacL
MNTKQILTKALFALLTLTLTTLIFTSQNFGGWTPFNAAIGLALGSLFSLLIFSLSPLIKRSNLRQLNTWTLGLLFGALFGYTLSFILSQGLSLAGLEANPILPIVTTIVYLTTLYLGVTLTLQSESELHLAIPFVKLEQKVQKKRDVLLDLSILQDPRIIDLASSGLLDQLVILPRFLVRELQEAAEGMEEGTTYKARRTLDVISKLEALPNLKLRYTDADFGEKDATSKMIRLARMIDSDLLTADISRIEQASIEGVRIINIHTLSNALKPLTHSGETLTIKVQRYGKEPRQGVGYLDDGTMVVINGGADFIGETIKTHVLSVKHTSSGRMIFCNALEDEEEEIPYRTQEHASYKSDRPRTPYTV